MYKCVQRKTTRPALSNHMGTTSEVIRNLRPQQPKSKPKQKYTPRRKNMSLFCVRQLLLGMGTALECVDMPSDSPLEWVDIPRDTPFVVFVVEEAETER